MDTRVKPVAEWNLRAWMDERLARVERALEELSLIHI